MPHTHPTDERLTIISGSFRVGMGEKFDEATMHEMSPGSYTVLPSGMAHFAKGAKETIVQIDSEGPFQITTSIRRTIPETPGKSKRANTKSLKE